MCVSMNSAPVYAQKTDSAPYLFGPIAFWMWTPETNKWINPKYAVKDTPQEQLQVGTDLYKTTNGGTAWSLETAIGYEVDFIDLEKDNTTVFLAKRDAAGTNRASLWDGAVLTHINTGKSTTGGATSGGDVV